MAIKLEGEKTAELTLQEPAKTPGALNQPVDLGAAFTTPDIAPAAFTTADIAPASPAVTQNTTADIVPVATADIAPAVQDVVTVEPAAREPVGLARGERAPAQPAPDAAKFFAPSDEAPRRLVTTTDALELSYPRYATNIRNARKKGFSDEEITGWLNNEEMTLRLSHAPDRVNEMMGRTDETIELAAEQFNTWRREQYIKISGLSEGEIDEMSDFSIATGIPLGTLIQNHDWYKELSKNKRSALWAPVDAYMAQKYQDQASDVMREIVNGSYTNEQRDELYKKMLSLEEKAREHEPYETWGWLARDFVFPGTKITVEYLKSATDFLDFQQLRGAGGCCGLSFAGAGDGCGRACGARVGVYRAGHGVELRAHSRGGR